MDDIDIYTDKFTLEKTYNIYLKEIEDKKKEIEKLLEEDHIWLHINDDDIIPKMNTYL